MQIVMVDTGLVYLWFNRRVIQVQTLPFDHVSGPSFIKLFLTAGPESEPLTQY